MAKFWFFLYGIALSCSGVLAQHAGSVDPSFQVGSGPNFSVQQLLALHDNKVLVRGSFTQWNGAPVRGLVRLNADGSLDSSFQLDAGVGTVDSVSRLPGNTLFVSARTTGGVLAVVLVRLGADGQVESVLPARPSGPVRAVAQLHDGRLLIAGVFRTIDGVARPGVAMLKADGTLDTSFVPEAGISGVGDSIHVREDGKFIIAGLNYSDGIHSVFGMLRMATDGSVDKVFNLGSPSFFAKAIFPIEHGNLVLDSTFNLTRVLDNDAIDQHYTNGARSVFARIAAVQPDGRQLVTGSGVLDATGASSRLVRLFADGKIDPSFRTALIGNPSTIVVRPDGKIIAGSTFNLIGASKIVALLGNDETARIEVLWHATDADAVHNGPVTIKVIRQGSLTNTAIVDWSATAQAGLQITPASGQAQFEAGESEANVEFNVASAPDATSSAQFVLADPQGAALGANQTLTLYVTNQTGAVSFSPAPVAVFEPHGSFMIALQRTGAVNRPAAVGWRVTGADPLSDLEAANGSSYFSAGETTTTISLRVKDDALVEANRSYQVEVFSIDADWPIAGATNTSLTIVENDIAGLPGQGANGRITLSRRLRDGSVLILGLFDQVNGVTREGAALLRPDGSLDASFNPGRFFTAVTDAIETADGQIVLLGAFSVAPDQANWQVVRMNRAGEIDPTFVARDVYVASTSLAQKSDGSFLISGHGTMLGAMGVTNYGALMRRSSTGVVDTNFVTFTAASGPTELLMLPNGQFYVYGNIMAHTNYYRAGASNAPPYRAGIIRFNADGAVDPTFAVTVAVTNRTGGGPIAPGGTNSASNGVVGPSDLYVYGDGRVLAAGSMSQVNGQVVSGLVRLSATGELDLPFLTNVTNAIGRNAGILDAAVNKNGKILVGRITGTPALILLDADGRAVKTLRMFGSDSTGFDVHANEDGSFVVTGTFTQIAESPRFRFAIIEADGTVRSLPGLVITGMSRGNGATHLKVSSGSSGAFSVQRSSTLERNSWVDVKEVNLVAGEQTVQIEDSGEMAFYRLTAR